MVKSTECLLKKTLWSEDTNAHLLLCFPKMLPATRKHRLEVLLNEDLFFSHYKNSRGKLNIDTIGSGFLLTIFKILYFVHKLSICDSKMAIRQLI
jgi:hypothetical protein